MGGPLGSFPGNRRGEEQARSVATMLTCAEECGLNLRIAAARYRRTNHDNMHVRGYKERGNINTPLELAISNEIDRFSLAMDVIKRVPRLRPIGAHAMERFRNMQIVCRNYAYEHGTDMPEVAGWRWPH